MRKVLRGYTKDQGGKLILVGTIPLPLAKTNPLQENVRTKGVWSVRGQRSSRKRRFTSRP